MQHSANPAPAKFAFPSRTGGATVVIPIFEDWDSAALLLAAIDREAAAWPGPGRVLLVDDGSNRPPTMALRDFVPRTLQRVDLLTLRRNVGHQSAIAIGLLDEHQRGAGDLIVVMDGDGEDDPADIVRLMDAADHRIAFAARTSRSEGAIFRLGYRGYQLLHRLATGRPMQCGNFSALPRSLVDRLIVSPDLRTHYAAAVARSRLPTVLVPTRRRPRLLGRSRMNLVGLVAHGLASLAVFGDVVGVRLLAATAIVGALASLVAVAAWASAASLTIAMAAALVAVLAAQAAGLEVLLLMSILDRSRTPVVLPAGGLEELVLSRETLAGGPTTASRLDTAA